MIIEYVRRNPKTTKREVVKSLDDEKLSSLLTTRKLLEELISSGTIKVAKDRPDGRNHYLYVNDESAFNKISQDVAIQEADIEKLVIQDPKKLPKEYPAENVILWNLVMDLFEAENLQEQDSQILYAKIKKLLLALVAKKVKALNS